MVPSVGGVPKDVRVAVIAGGCRQRRVFCPFDRRGFSLSEQLKVVHA
jgi:hypothetical protein